MCCTVTLILVLFRVLDATWGQELSNETVTDETLAEQWLQELDGNLAQKLYESVHARWNYNTNMTKENALLSGDASLRLSLYQTEACKNASRFAWKNFTDASLIRRFDDVTSGCSSLTEDEIKQMGELTRNMSSVFSTAEFCRNKSDNGSCIREDPGLRNLMAASRHWDELQWAWEGWRKVSGRKIKPLYVDFVALLNKDAKLQGFQDYGDYWQSAFEMENFASACEELWQQVKPLYQQLHAYVRRKLMVAYPQNLRDFPSTRHIPAHILGNIWAQTWDNIRDLVDPFPNSSVINVTKMLTDQGFTALRMFQEADAFFTSLGLPAMPPEFWKHSLIEKPKDGRKVVCHPSASNFFNGRDFRIKQCTEVTGQFFGITHHEMGHIQYFINYKDQPIFFQDGANPGFHEAIGDVITLSVMTPEHLRKINLLNDTTDDYVCESLWDLCFVVDASGSICDADPNFNFTRDETCNNWNFILQFMHRFVDGLNIGLSQYRVGMVIFGTTSRVEWNLTAYTTKDALLNAIDHIQYHKGGRTDTTGGLNMMRNQVFGVDGDRSNVSNVAIVITDGKSTDPTTVPAAIDAVHNSGITTLVVGVTDQVDEPTLKQLSSPPSQLGKTYFIATDFQSIDGVRVQLENQTCAAVQTGSITPSTNAITSAGSSTPSTNAVSSLSPVTSPTSRQPIESDMNFLMKQALEKVAFLPYGYLIDRWRWEIFNGTTTPENYNKAYWKLRCGLQGISPPVTRSEEDFDPGAKFHIGINAGYISYFVAHIIQFQFHKSLCDAAGHVGPLHKCDIYKSKAAGDKLRKMLSMGSSKPWPDAMEVMTGQRKMDAGPLLEYFRPLQKWLENENKGQDVSWDEECLYGSNL